MKHKEPFRFIRKWVETYRHVDGGERRVVHCEYEASFWEGPSYAGQEGRYVRTRCLDQVTESGGFLNTSPGVSYYGALRKACGL